MEHGASTIDIFFTLSGFVLVYVYQEKFGMSDFLIKRFTRLYPVRLVTLADAIILLLGARIMGAVFAAAILHHTVEKPAHRMIMSWAR